MRITPLIRLIISYAIAAWLHYLWVWNQAGQAVPRDAIEFMTFIFSLTFAPVLFPIWTLLMMAPHVAAQVGGPQAAITPVNWLVSFAICMLLSQLVFSIVGIARGVKSPEEEA
ncbi:hypothetical protein DB346_12230 [Verrucomicrobia bacterium LW23]|nr:hypothetical protein DB346_12230 [Verrucomicrobia bacterium LW23]